MAKEPLCFTSAHLSLSPQQPKFFLRPNLLLPNHLDLMETLEDAPDPFFGMISVDPILPSPFNIPQVGLNPLGHLRLISQCIQRLLTLG